MLKRISGSRAGLLVAAVALLALAGTACSNGSDGAGQPQTLRGVLPSSVMLKPDIVLTDADGELFDLLAETEGRVTLLYFGYTHCADICPTHMADLAAAIDRTGTRERVKVVFISVDPQRDTPERLKLWLGLFDDTFVGLTGDPADIDAAAHATLGDLHQPTTTRAYGDGEYTVSHPAVVIAYDAAGVARVLWPFGFRVDDYVNDLMILTDDEGAS